MDANSEFAVTALSEGSRVPSILFGVCSTLPYPTVDIGHVGFCCWRYKDANLEFAVHCLIQGLHLAYNWAGWTGVNAARAEEHQRSKGVLVFLESCCDWGSCCLVWRRFALPFTPSLLSFQKDCFVIPFFHFFLGGSCRLGSRRFSRCVSWFWVGVSCSVAQCIHRCIGFLRNLLGLGMGFLLTCVEMVCADLHSLASQRIFLWLLFFARLFLDATF